jgi:hypothetical protein
VEAASEEDTGEVQEENYENTMVWNEEAGTDTAGLEAADVKYYNTLTDNTRVTIEPEIEDVINKLDAGDGVKNESSVSETMNLGHSEEQEVPDPPMAAHIFANYPRIYPFEDNEITLCVKIEPKDIGYLSKDAWALSNNSFLLHGFYSYQHLIFAKMKDRYGCRYILGVPGIYHNREKFMAKMFGFESFKPIRKRELRQGDFGYWYLPISL